MIWKKVPKEHRVFSYIPICDEVCAPRESEILAGAEIVLTGKGSLTLFATGLCSKTLSEGGCVGIT